MSVETFEEIYRDRGRVGREDAERTRYFFVKTNRVEDDIDTLLLARPDLAPYQPHPRLRGLFVDDFDADRIEGTLHWNVTVRYAPVEGEERKKNPLARPAKISWGTSQFTRFTLTDYRGRARLNTAGDLLDPTEREDARWVISISKNVARVPQLILSYNLAVNSDSPVIQGIQFPRETLLLKGLKISEQKFDVATRTPYFVFSYQLHFSPSGWKDRPLNRGRRELEAGGTELVEIRTGKSNSGDPITKPVFLSRNGVAFRVSQGENAGKLRRPKRSEIIALEFDLYRPLPFTVLPTQ